MRLGSVRQSLSALCASSLEDVSAVGSSHSLAEAVLLLSLTLFRLVSSEHGWHLLAVVCCGELLCAGPAFGSVRGAPDSEAWRAAHRRFCREILRFYTMTIYIISIFRRICQQFF